MRIVNESKISREMTDAIILVGFAISWQERKKKWATQETMNLKCLGRSNQNVFKISLLNSLLCFGTTFDIRNLGAGVCVCVRARGIGFGIFFFVCSSIIDDSPGSSAFPKPYLRTHLWNHK